MQSSSFLHNLLAHLKSGLSYLRDLLRNIYFWGGLTVLVLVGLGSYFLFNNLIMPSYTRYDTQVRVPPVLNRTFEEAQQTLQSVGLRAERMESRFNPMMARDVVTEQSPKPNAMVKPGRRIYLKVNTGETPKVTVPRVEGMSRREAENLIYAARLEIEDILADSIPSPYRNTVTRQDPKAGETVEEKTPITLWISTGLGDRYTDVPDVTGMRIAEARAVLLRKNLRAVVVDEENYEAPGDPIILRQSRDVGTRVREGFEIRLFITEE